MNALKIILFFAVLVAGIAALRKLPNRRRAFIWIIGSALLLPFWIRNGIEDHWTWFVWMKLFSILFACLWAELCATRFLAFPRLIAVSVWLILVANMVEAVVFDVTHGRMLNPIAGVLLIVAAAIAPPPRVEARGPGREVVYDLGWIWIVAYTIWNIGFVYGNTPGILGRNIALLGAALALSAYAGQKSWLLLRAYTYGLFCFMVNTFYGGFQTWLDTTSWSDPATYGAVAVLSGMGALAAILSSLAAWLGRRRKVPSLVG